MMKDVVLVLYGAGAGMEQEMEQETAEPLQIYPPSQPILVPGSIPSNGESLLSALCAQHPELLLLLSIASS